MRNKVAVAAMVLAVGGLVAVLFRREARPPEAPSTEPTFSAAGGVASERMRGVETAPAPRFAGGIEPVGPELGEQRTGGEKGLFSAGAHPSLKDDFDGQRREEQSLAAIEGGTRREVTSRPAEVAGQGRAERPRVELEEDGGASGTERPSRGKLAWRSPLGEVVVDPRSIGDLGGDRMKGAGEQATHQIVDGDTLAALAQRYLGESERAEDLFAFNRDVLRSAELLPIGAELRIPPAGFRAAERINEKESRSSPPANGSLTPLASADETSQAAGAAMRDVAASAGGYLPQGVSGSDALGGGSAATATAGSSARRTYVVQAHDTAGLIARKIYGDARSPAGLLRANGLKSGRELRPGMVLVVPSSP